MIDQLLSQVYQMFPEIYQLKSLLNQFSNTELVIYTLAIIGGTTTLKWVMRKIV